MPIRTCHESYYKACIREACRYAAIKHLSDRNAVDSKDGGRQDMAGIKPFVDLHATLAIVFRNLLKRIPQVMDQKLRNW